MIDFACKRFNIKEIIKCSLGLTKVEYQILEYFIRSPGKEMTTNYIASELDINQTTAQKTVKKLFEQNIIKRTQKNLENGGYVFIYQAYPKPHIHARIKEIIQTWSKNVEEHIDTW